MPSMDFSVSSYAPSSTIFAPPVCTDVAGDLQVPAGWAIDLGLGDPAHPGISELTNTSNPQADASLTGYTYLASTDRTVHVGGRICGAAFWGPPARFERTYRVFLRPAPLPPPTQFQDFVVSAYAPGGFFLFSPVPYRDFATQYATPAGWVVDRNQGDAAHPGISEIGNRSNAQANASLQNYSYYAASDTAVAVSGRISGAFWGSGAIFERTYRVFLRPA
jgi:hypothetical protein